MHETREHARLEARTHTARVDGRHDHLHAELTDRQVFVQTSFREPALSAASQAGMVNNLNDGLAWGLFPVLFAAAGLPVGQIGVLVALYPAVWGFGQLLTGALSDRTGRKPLITGGMLLQAAALALVAATHTFALWALAAVLLGAGTALVYPTLLAAIGDVAHPAWRARAVGVYRLWRDGGFAVGALLAGALADAFGLVTAIWAVAVLTAASGAVVAARMYETHPARRAVTFIHQADRDSAARGAAAPRLDQADELAHRLELRPRRPAPRTRQRLATTLRRRRVIDDAVANDGRSEGPPIVSGNSTSRTRRPRPATGSDARAGRGTARRAGRSSHRPSARRRGRRPV